MGEGNGLADEGKLAPTEMLAAVACIYNPRALMVKGEVETVSGGSQASWAGAHGTAVDPNNDAEFRVLGTSLRENI